MLGDLIGGILVLLLIAAIIAFFTEPVFRWIVIIVFIIVIVLVVLVKGKKGGGSGRGYSSGGSSEVSAGSYSDSGSSTAEIGCLHRGSYAGGFVLASYRDGKVFDGYDSGLNMSFYKASYSGGRIYGSNGSLLGHYENSKGYIYRGGSDSYSAIVGRCERGYIYDSPSGSNIVGSYVGDPEGAAAAALVFLF